MDNLYRILLICLAALAVCGGTGCSEGEARTPSERGYIQAPPHPEKGSEPVKFRVAETMEGGDAERQGLLLRDPYAAGEVSREHELFEVKVGTEVLVMEATETLTKIRILGDGEYKGKVGWIGREWVLTTQKPKTHPRPWP